MPALCPAAEELEEMFMRLVDVLGAKADTIGALRSKLETLLCSPLPEPVEVELEPMEAMLEAMDKNEIVKFSKALLKAMGIYVNESAVTTIVVESETLYDTTIHKHIQQYRMKIYTIDNLLIQLNIEYKLGEKRYNICYEVWQRTTPPQQPQLLHSTCK